VQVSDSSTAERAAQKLGTHFGFPVSFNANFKLPHYRKASQRLTFRHADFPLMWILVTKCNGFIVPYCGEVKASARMGITTKSDIGWQRRFLCGSELIWCNLIESGRSETGYGRRTLICSGYPAARLFVCRTLGYSECPGRTFS
jgi:hypothetical protein